MPSRKPQPSSRRPKPTQPPESSQPKRVKNRWAVEDRPRAAKRRDAKLAALASEPRAAQKVPQTPAPSPAAGSPSNRPSNGRTAKPRSDVSPTRRTFTPSAALPFDPDLIPRVPAISPMRAFGPYAEARFGRMLMAIRARLDRYDWKELAGEVQALSHALTRSRSSTVRQDYLALDLTRAAYCAHFLPWNVCRLLLMWSQSAPEWLKPISPLSQPRPEALVGPKGAPDTHPAATPDSNDAIPATATKPSITVEDWGAGPATAMLALWVSGATDRANITYHPIERQGAMLDWGLKILADLKADRACRIRTRVGAIEFDHPDADDDAFVAETNSKSRADLLIVSQAYNEWLPPRGRSDQAARAFARLATRSVKPGGEIMVMEPANRIASWGVMTLREVLLASGHKVLAPCTHDRPCPLLSNRLKTWCHFRINVEPHPDHAPLIRLSNMPRTHLSFSYLRCQTAANPGATFASPAVLTDETESLPTAPRRATARILSDPIRLDDGTGVYACGHHGHLVFDTRARKWKEELVAALAQGEVVRYRAAGPARTDQKSGARKIFVAECRGEDGSQLTSAGAETDKRQRGTGPERRTQGRLPSNAAQRPKRPPLQRPKPAPGTRFGNSRNLAGGHGKRPPPRNQGRRP